VKTLELEKASPAFRRAARDAKGGVLVLTEKGKPAFAVVGVKDELALEALALRRNAAFMAYLDEISLRTRSGRGRSLQEVERELGRHPRPSTAASRRK
jgi:hypothetical protein